MRLKYMNIIKNSCILNETLCPQQRSAIAPALPYYLPSMAVYAVFGKISAATLPDSSVTIAIAMPITSSWDESNKRPPRMAEVSILQEHHIDLTH